jgi:hypothetical protein
LFPRSTLRDLIRARVAGDESRARWQISLFTFALALLALGLPTARLVGEGPDLVRWTEAAAWMHVHVFLMPLAQALSHLPGMGAERAWFLISALCWASTFPVLVGLCRGLGFRRSEAIAGAVLALSAPIAWLAATIPGPSAPGLLGGALLLRALLSPSMKSEHAPRNGYRRAAISCWLFASLLDLSLSLLFPAVACAVLTAPREPDAESPRRRWDAAALAFGALVFAGLLIGAAFVPGAAFRGAEFLRQAWHSLTGDLQRPALSTTIWLVLLVPSLGLGTLGLFYLAQRPRSRDEAPPPAWLAVWCAFPFLFQIVFGVPKLDMPAIILAPVLALGCASWIASWSDEHRAKRIVALIVGQVAMLGAFCVALGQTDPDLAWTRVAQKRLAASDLVLTRSRTHEYLLRHRFEVRALDLSAPTRLAPDLQARWWSEARAQVESAHEANRRVVLDWKLAGDPLDTRAYPFENEVQRLLLLAPAVELDERSH